MRGAEFLIEWHVCQKTADDAAIEAEGEESEGESKA
jgi:hypothetical protein